MYKYTIYLALQQPTTGIETDQYIVAHACPYCRFIPKLLKTENSIDSPCKVILACIRGAGGHSNLSYHCLRKAILQFYTQFRLFPSGVVAEMELAQEWALRRAKALKKLEFWQISDIYL
jgi:glutaredoxin